MKEYGLAKPVIDADEHWFSVTFARKAEQKTGASLQVAGTRVKTRVKTRVIILDLLKAEPEITRADIAQKTGITLKGIDWQIARLKKENALKRVGSDKSGYWEVLK